MLRPANIVLTRSTANMLRTSNNVGLLGELLRNSISYTFSYVSSVFPSHYRSVSFTSLSLTLYIPRLALIARTRALVVHTST